MSKASKKNNDDNEFERKDAAQDDDDYDYPDQNKSGDDEERGNNALANQPTKKIENMPYDEGIELSDGGSEIPSDTGENSHEESRPKDYPDEAPAKPQVNKQQQQSGPTKSGQPQKGAPIQKKEKGESDEEEDDAKIPGMYNPAEYAHLAVSSEIQELFKYITRYKPVTVDIDTQLKAFIPDFIPAVGEVDAFIKPSRPDGQQELLGLLTIDEPCLNQSKKSKLDLEIKELIKKKKNDAGNATVHSIEHAEKNPKEISHWISDVQEIHKKKQPPSVVYTKAFPEIETLMQEWPLEIEEALSHLKLPTEEIDMDLSQYCKLACALLDIPVHNTTNNKNLVESLHVFFTLYSEFRANPHFQQKMDQQNY